MSTVDEEAALRLLRESPPAYHGSSDPSNPFEEFEVDDRPRLSRNWIASLKNFGAQRITRPVSRIVDPIAQFLNKWKSRIEQRIDSCVNIFIVKRVVFLMIVGAVAAGWYFAFFENISASGGLRDHTRMLAFVNEDVDPDRIRETSEFLAKMPHFAGSQADIATARFVHDSFLSYGLRAAYDKHSIFLSHGNTSLCELFDENGETIFTSDLQEAQALDTGELSQKQPPTQMSLVLPGEAYGKLVYANFGSDTDFDGVDCDKTIALVKIGYEPLGDVAMRAQSRGVAGLLFMAAKSADEQSWPEGRDYPADAIPQGSLGWPQVFPGDILSPGWPSSDVMTLSQASTYLPKLPAAAISWKDAQPLLKSLEGHGVRAAGNNGFPENTEFWTGPNENTRLKLVTNPIVENRHQIQNVIGQIKGNDEEERLVVVGARIDAMCYGTSQLAGLNVIMEAARVLANLRRKEHWDPLRTVQFVLWDGTAHNYAGSTEWGEDVAKSLNHEAVTYIDLDLGISGSQLQVRGNPIFDFNDTLKKIPLNKEHSLHDAVMGETTPIPGYGNHLIFEAHSGVPTIQLGFVDESLVLPKDSCFDSIEFMHKFGDPNWERHAALARLVANLVLEVADAPMLPHKFNNFAESMADNAWRVKQRVDERFGADFFDSDRECHDLFNNMLKEINAVKEAAKIHEQVKRDWTQYMIMNKDKSTGNLAEVLPVTRMRHYWNGVADAAIKSLVDVNGILERNWYKNHFLGPRRNQTVASELSGVFPGIQDAIDSHNRDGLAKSLEDATSRIALISVKLKQLIF